MISIRDIFTLLDNSSINWKAIIAGLTVGEYLFVNYLKYRQYQVLKRKTPPDTLKAEITLETFEKTQDYGRAKLKFDVFKSTFSVVQNLAVVYFDFYPKVWSWSSAFMSKCSFLLPRAMNGVLTQSAFFFILNLVISTVSSLPFGYYQNFVLEEKYGFNKSTLKLWITDSIKGLAIAITLGTPVISAFFKIIDYYGESFIIYGCAFTLVLQFAALTVIPNLIMPLFYTYSPLEDGELKTEIEKLAAKNKFPLKHLYVIDGSKRSAHSNAFFTGLPWSKQIVLFDTLIKHSDVEEVVAVLAHELGHWKMSHISTMVAFNQMQLFFMFAAFSAFIYNNSLYGAFGFTTAKPALIGYLLFSLIFLPIECLLTFGDNLLSRRNEYQADDYAKKSGYAEPLATGLIKLCTENLSSSDADWLYASYYHSHPILPERLRAIGYVSKNKVSKKDD